MLLNLYKMDFARLTVVLAVILTAHCIEAEVCSNDDEVFCGIARDRYVMSNSKAVRLDVSKLSSVCEAGVNCREFCMLDALELNIFLK